MFILIAIAGYFLIALEAVASKFLLSGRIKNWKLYVFYVGILSLFTLVFAPFGLHWYGWKAFGISLASGATLFVYLALIYRALEKQPASVVYVISGATSTIGVLLLSYIFLQENLSPERFMGIFLLIVGGVLIALKPKELKFVQGLGWLVAAGFITAVSLVLLKIAYDQQNFVSGYVFSRLGEALATLAVLMWPKFRQNVFQDWHKKKTSHHTKNFSAVTVTKILAGLGTLLVNIAIFRGSVTVVNALVSTQYFFIFVLSVLLSVYFWRIFAEDMRRENLFSSSVGLVLVILGVCLVSLG